jgi:hypothetical protein
MSTEKIAYSGIILVLTIGTKEKKNMLEERIV